MNEPGRLEAGAAPYTVLVFCVLALLIGGVSMAVLAPFASAIAWAVVLAVAADVPWSWLERRLAPRRDLAAALMTLGIALVVALPAALLAGILAAQASGFASTVADELRTRNVHAIGDLAQLPIVARAAAFLEERTGVSGVELSQRAVTLAGQAAGLLAQKSGAFVLSLFDALLTFILTAFFLYFFLRDGKEMAGAVIDVLPISRERRIRVAASLLSMLRAIFRGSLLCALVQGLTGGFGWWLAGLSSPALAGAAMAILSLLPVGGTAIVWLPGAVVLWATGHHGASVFLVVWGAVVTSVLADNVLRPILIGRTTELNTLVVFVGVFGGLGAFGLLGIFVGPIALALAATMVQVLRGANPEREVDPLAP